MLDHLIQEVPLVLQFLHPLPIYTLMAVNRKMQQQIRRVVKHIRLEAHADVGLLMVGQRPEVQSLDLQSEQQEAQQSLHFSHAQWPSLSSIDLSQADFVTHSQDSNRIFQAEWSHMQKVTDHLYMLEPCQHLQTVNGGC